MKMLVRVVQLRRGDELLGPDPKIVDEVLPTGDPNELRVWWYRWEKKGSGSFAAHIHDEYWVRRR